MRTLCAWCQAEGKEMVMKEGDKEGPLSHGICKAHEEKLIAEIAKGVPVKRTNNPRRRRKK